MEILKFKTNIKCSGCIAAITPHLNNLPEIQKWEVAIQNPDKVLTIEGNPGIDAQKVIHTITAAGYSAESI